MSDVSSPPPRALLSVWDKTDIVSFAKGLVELGFELVSTGGTARTLSEAGLPVMSVSDVTQHPEIFDGRVKSLHPAIHGPLLARLHQESDEEELERLGYVPLRVVACNLYPFVEAAATQPPLDDPALLEMVDIGGPTMVRASAKNHQHVLIATNPGRYESILAAIRDAGSVDKVSMDLRQTLALEAFEHTAAYDAAIAQELHRRYRGDPATFDVLDEQRLRFPTSVFSVSHQLTTLRYGENAHQAAALYIDQDTPKDGTTLVTAPVEGEKAMSYNNYSDADATLRLCRSLSTDEWPNTPHACVIVKHNNPCGAALGATQR
ncbi:MAG: bifunctional phosphoribosylaminoimidazolecarboxamide formyltransferase/IMP cyclohydrolase, partial [archaeon]|nr:bifunctional phosphoribosylaminoimidazolecarboxamide formyltransferase/IMP cyclohydrolase [archaeon]